MTPSRSVTRWSSALDLRDLIEAELRASGVLNLRVGRVAVVRPRARWRRPRATCSQNTSNRQLVIVDEGPAISLDVDVEFVIGEHPRPGLGSLMAGERLVEFLEGSKNAECTIFLISGGASSLCALRSRRDLDDLGELFAQCSSRCGHHDTQPTACGEFADRRGAILRRVRTSRSIASSWSTTSCRERWGGVGA